MSGPPRHALHGPWDWPVERYEKTEILTRVASGECDCACCTVRGHCAELPMQTIGTRTEAAWMWIRQPTPRMKREEPDRAKRVINWPLWIYEHIGIQAAKKSVASVRRAS